MSFLSLFGPLSQAHISVFTFFSGAKRVGKDATGNVYFQAKPRKGYARPRRWVKYQGAPEATKVPPEWHGWLHHQTDDVPTEGQSSFRRKWQKPHMPNMTGTEAAYRPPGHAMDRGVRDKATGDYEAWTPNNKKNQ